ncbi:MAG: SufE family protein [Myxococcota bacterium]
METTLEELAESFELLDDWMDRYKTILDLGAELDPMEDGLKVDAHKVKGCMSQVWLVGTLDAGGRMQFLADSDAHLVKGLIAIVLMLYGNKTPAEILETDHAPVLAELGLDKHLSPGRSNGLHSMIKRIRTLAEAHLSRGPEA